MFSILWELIVECGLYIEASLAALFRSGWFWTILFSLAIVFSYIVTAQMVYAINMRRGLKVSWMAWIPVLQLWNLGNIADHYQRAVHGKKNYWRWCLPVLTLGRDVLFCYSVVGTIVMAMAAVFAGLLGAFTGEGSPENLGQGLQQDFDRMHIFLIVACVLAVLQRLAKTLVLYRVYRSCKPEKAWVRALCSLLPCVPVVQLHILRDYDEGMPTPELREDSVQRAESENSQEKSSAETR